MMAITTSISTSVNARRIGRPTPSGCRPSEIGNTKPLATGGQEDDEERLATQASLVESEPRQDASAAWYGASRGGKLEKVATCSDSCYAIFGGGQGIRRTRSRATSEACDRTWAH